MTMKGKILKLNWYCKEDEAELWQRFGGWLWLHCDLTPLDFACLSYFEKTLFMMAFWAHNSNDDMTNVALDHLKREARKLCRNSLAVLADRKDKADFLKSREYEGNYAKFTFFGKESEKP